MIKIVVILDVNNFDALSEFEQIAVKVMAKYQGGIISAFETSRFSDGTGEEVHILEFPSEQEFLRYRNDESLVEYADLRKKAISNTQIKISSCFKSYIN
jgi:uncharacterized protein (DUF1330 family)